VLIPDLYKGKLGVDAEEASHVGAGGGGFIANLPLMTNRGHHILNGRHGFLLIN
jgi:hypothetical protein